MTRPRLLIVGAGPAGVSAALWARDRFEAVIIDRGTKPGGQLLGIHFAPSDLTLSEDHDGAALAAIAARQLDRSGVSARFGCAAVGLDPPALVEAGSAFESEIEPLRAGGAVVGSPRVRIEIGEPLEADAVVIATGLRRRRLGVPGEDALEGRGVSASATKERRALADRDVIVVGGGDGAYESALLLADVGCRVLLVMRGRPRARREFRARVASQAGIEVMRRTEVRAVLGGDRVSAVRLEGPRGTFDRDCEAVIVKIGAVPNTEWCAAALRTDRDGFIRIDRRGRTSAPRVWAAGDVVRPALFAISVAESSGALAVQDAWELLGGRT